MLKRGCSTVPASAKFITRVEGHHPDFLASRFIQEDELPPLLEAARKEGLTIIWIPLRPCLYEETVIGEYQAAYNPGTPLSTLPVDQQEIALAQIARRIKSTRLSEIAGSGNLGNAKFRKSV